MNLIRSIQNSGIHVVLTYAKGGPPVDIFCLKAHYYPVTLIPRSPEDDKSLRLQNLDSMEEMEISFESLRSVEIRKGVTTAILHDGQQLKGSFGITSVGLAAGHWDIELIGIDRSGMLQEIEPDRVSRLEFRE